MPETKQNFRGDVRYNAAVGKVVRTLTMEHTDPVADEVTKFAVQKLNEAFRCQEADELNKLPQRMPMDDPRDGSGTPADMESEG